MTRLKKRWRLALIIAGCLVILVALSAWGFAAYYENLLRPVDSRSTQEVTVKIPSGASVSDIARLLEKKGLVKKAWALEFYVRWNHLNNYHSGTYAFSRKMSVGEIMELLKKGEHPELILLIDVRQGMWVSEVANQMSRVSGISKKELLSDLRSRSYVQKHYMPAYPFLTRAILTKGIDYPLEGYLAPGVYRFKAGKKPLTLDQMVRPMLDETGSELKKNAAAIKKSPLGSVHRILTMASLVEQEAPNAADRRKISGVFNNRLKLNMKLQTDPSVAYGRQRRITNYSKHDLTTDTPYNTYTRKGLTVGPIGSPAPDALDAVLHPVKSDNLFFYARPNGKVYYSKTYAQHQKIIRKYGHEWASKS
ncbi:endolytic transglycosylase MltG [Sporolactobacillus vineae]|uniref:endolytic transglycosylase MltG n=1 Tax=Sporolactobacillus vineae TaxID=444463 RepID=UPI0002886436|nr:endolytic transglycosylase MltG [Sporolactobacillus vineae]